MVCNSDFTSLRCLLLRVFAEFDIADPKCSESIVEGIALQFRLHRGWLSVLTSQGVSLYIDSLSIEPLDNSHPAGLHR